jgi:hypothetical protein
MIIDKYGRAISVEQIGGLDVYSVGGMQLSFVHGTGQQQALAAIEGMAPESAELDVPSCTDLQFRLAINQLGLRDTVETYVAEASQDVKDWWERATIIRADNELLLAAASALNKTQADVDAAISLGKTLA